MKQQTCTSSFFLMVFGVLGMSYGAIAENIPLYTLIGASIGITFGIISEYLTATGQDVTEPEQS